MKLVQPIRNLDKIEEVKQILLKDSYRNHFLFLLGINVGLRISDLLLLKVGQVRGRTHLILREGKTGKTKRLVLNSSIRHEIEKYTEGMQNEEYLFASKRTGTPIGRVQAYKILNKAADQAGLQEVGTHTLRKTFGYHYYKLTKDVVKLQNIFNHSAPSVTLTYIGITQEEIDESMEDFYL